MKKKYFPIVLVFVFLQFFGFAHGAIPAIERAALIALYNSTNGDSWRYNSGWKMPPLHIDGFAMPGTESSWKGVRVEVHHVTNIRMSGNKLSGSIPSQLGNLSNLTLLDLSMNRLSGSIPSELGNLSKLEHLWLDNNTLIGSIPSELGNLSNLTSISFGNNRLSGSIPSQLGNLSKLRSLALYNNRLSGSIPSELCNLKNLTLIRMEANQLNGSISSQLGNLSKLQWLDLSSNRLSGSIPFQLGNLSNLRELYLDDNQLSGSIPSQLGNLSNLQNFNLGFNQLGGSIPSQLGNLSNLFVLYLNDNQLSGSIPSELGNFSNLIYLYLNDNQLSGRIPSQLGNLRELEEIDLSLNQLSGKIPTEFTNLQDIEFVDIGYNCLSATDPHLIIWLSKHDHDWKDHQDQCGGSVPEKNPPFGSFETPIDGSTVAGSIAVTGWALDNTGIANVKIYFNQGNKQTYIGDALFVEGARPDVAAAYPEYPSNTKAGWGYMILTNLLPGEGNGEFVLSAIATDTVGKTTTLGTKTIITDNAHAVKPFGAIDTPTQGGTASGTEYRNNGWALTPMPDKIAVDGSTIHVFIDGVLLGHVTYNLYRQDIAELFPGYANSDNAWGYFDIDTTNYSNGVHTIFWTAEDTGGKSDGIGSRYFSIQNSSSDRAQGVTTSTMQTNLQVIALLPEDFPGPIKYNKGFNVDDECRELLPDENGNNRLLIKELERVEIQLGEDYADIQGYLISGNQLNKLPIGSTLDARCGTFSWSPGPGFLGSYSLVFVLTDSNGQSYKKFIEITIEPGFNGQQ